MKILSFLHRPIVSGIAASLLVSSGVWAADPCSETTQLSGGRVIQNTNSTGSTGNGNYHYEIWRDGNGGKLTLYSKDACFKAEWNNAGDFLGRVGLKFNSDKTYSQLGGDLVANYNYKKSGNDGGTYSYIGIYGWMQNPEIEYYIVDDWLHDRGTPGGSYMGSKIGTITVDGAEYAVWSGKRTGASISGTSTFTQIFSIRQSRRQCGTINISEHFRQWEKLGLNLGKLYESKILAESGGGSGYVDFTYATVEITTQSSSSSSSSGNSGNTDSGNSSSSSSSSSSKDPCSQTTKLSGGTTVTSNGIRDIGNGYNYELWRDGSSGSMTYFGGDNDCAFKASWNNSGDFLARVGYYYGGSNSKTYKDLNGDIHAEFNYTKSGNAGGYSYIGMYGWTNTPQIEYYIVEDSWNGMGTPYNTTQKGSYTVDGATYKLYTGTRTNAPSITGTSTFTQVFAVRSSARQCGHISVSEHFRNWEKNGVTLGGLYDCKILCEAGGGTGSIEFTYATMYIGDKAEETPEVPKVPQGPYTEAIAIPGIVEAENYDVGGNGYAYYDSDDENEGDANFRTDEGVDIVVAGTGKGIGYTKADEWTEYTVNIAKTGKYDVEALASNGNATIKLTLYLDDKQIASLSGDKTEDWDTYTTLTATTSELTAGEHILKLKIGADYCNVDYLKFTLEGTDPSGVEEVFQPASIVLAPNPTDGAFSVISPQKVVKVEVFDMVGTRMLSQEDVSGKIATGLRSGIYLVKIYTEDGTCVTRKLQVR